MLESPPPPTTQAEVMWSPFGKALEHSQRVEIKCLIEVEWNGPVDEDLIP